MPKSLECGFIEETEAPVQNEHSKKFLQNIKQEDLVHGHESVSRPYSSILPSCSSIGKLIKQELYPVLGTVTLHDVDKKKTFLDKLEMESILNILQLCANHKIL